MTEPGEETSGDDVDAVNPEETVVESEVGTTPTVPTAEPEEPPLAMVSEVLTYISIGGGLGIGGYGLGKSRD